MPRSLRTGDRLRETSQVRQDRRSRPGRRVNHNFLPRSGRENYRIRETNVKNFHPPAGSRATQNCNNESPPAGDVKRELAGWPVVDGVQAG